MKTKLLFILLMASLSCLSQDRNWVVSFNPTNLYINQANVGLEFNEGKNSIMLNVGIPWNKDAIGKLGISGNDYSFNKLGTEAVRVAYRHYAGKPLNGFYYEGYLKEQTIRADFVTQNPSTGILKGWLYSTSAGFQLGYQFLFWKRLTLDIYPVGLEAGIISGRINGSAKTNGDALKLAEFVQDKINSDLPGYMKQNWHLDQYDNIVQGRLSNSGFPAFRSGVSIGIIF